MTVRLDEFRSNDQYTVDGEAGIIAHIFDRLGVGSRVAVEFGAGDGHSCSNTARLWSTEGWTAVLVESDPALFKTLCSNARPYSTMCEQKMLQPSGVDSIDQVLEDHGVDAVDFMSIDIDGNDYFILEHLKCRPRVICVEFNPTIPPHVEMRQYSLGHGFGASLLSLVRLAASKGYEFIGATRCNAFFVRDPESNVFAAYEKNLSVLFPPEVFTYAVTDYQGRVVLCGQPLPWQAREPYVLPLAASTNIMPVTMDPNYMRTGFEAKWGPACWLHPSGLSKERLVGILSSRSNRLVCIDVSAEAEVTKRWMTAEGPVWSYATILTNSVLGFIREEDL